MSCSALLEAFHAKQALQAECQENLRNEAEYLAPENTEDQISCLLPSAPPLMPAS